MLQPITFTVRELAAHLSVDEKTIYRLVGRGELPGFKVAGTWRFRRDEIDTWIMAARGSSTVRSPGRIRALLVEDDEIDRIAIRRAIREAGAGLTIEIVEVGTLAGARAALAEGRFDCAVLDFHLPDGDGFALLQEDDLLESTAVVVLTGLDDEEVARTALRKGAQDYLVKGRIDGAALMKSVHYAIERRRFEEERRRSAANFRQLIESAPDAICVCRDGGIVYANPALEALLGVSGAGGVAFAGFVCADDRERAVAEMHVAAAGGRPAPMVEIRLQRPDGAVRTVECWVRGVVFDGVDAVLLTARDISPRKQLEQQVHFASRMAAVGTLAAGAAHEINNPLAYVVGNLDFACQALEVLRTTAAVTEVLDAMQEAREGANRIRNVVRDLRTFSRTGEDARGVVAVRRVVETAMNVAYVGEIRTKARLVKDFRAAPFVVASENRITQALTSLLTNAAQAIPAGNPLAHEIRVVVDQLPAGEVIVEVHDTGCGIPPEHLGRIFDPFFTTRTAGQGMGLGLALCQGIVTSAGGRIEVETKRGRGSVFRLVLPPAESVAPGVAADGAPAGGRVLIVDAEPLIGRMLARSLAAHDVQVVEHGREALAFVEAGERYDLILCDLAAGGADLYEDVAFIAPPLAERFVFAVAGTPTPEERAFLDRVPNIRLEKPVSAQTLAALVRAQVPRVGSEVAA